MLTQYINKAIGGLEKVAEEGSKSPFQSRVEEFGNLHFNDLKTAYITYHQTVWDNLLKYSGVLWTQWNNQTKMFDIVNQDDEWTPTPEINKFSSSIDAMLSNFDIPEVECIPTATNDMSAYAISDIGTKLAQYLSKVNALTEARGDEDKSGRAAAHFVLAGSVLTHVFPSEETIGTKPVMGEAQGVNIMCRQCDTNQTVPQEQVQADPSQGAVCPQCGGPTEMSPMPMQVDTGQTEPVVKHGATIEIGDPLFMLPRPGALSMKNLRYGLWAERMSTDEVYERWQHDAQPDQLYLDGYSSSYENALQYYMTGSASQTSRTKEECMVVQMIVEPGKVKAIPEGCYAVMVNGTWIHIEEYQFIDHPLTKANYRTQPKLFFGRTDANDLSKLQKETNHYEAIIKLHGMTASMDPIMVDDNTVVDEITNRGDRVIKWRSLGPGSHPPARLQHGTLDNGVYLQRDYLSHEFENASHAVNVQKGEAPGSITAASAISQLRGQAEQMFSRPMDNWNSLWVETIRKGVVILQQTMEPWEIAKIIGPGKEVEIAAFKEADLNDQLEFISSAHGLPKTRDERRTEMLTLFDHGALDPSDMNVKERIHELFGETGMMQQFNKDATRARMENQSIKDGTLQNPMPMVGIEDLSVHAEIHKEAIKSLDFDKWDPAAKEVMMHHCMDTVEALMMQQEQMAGPVPGDSTMPNQAGAGQPKPPNGGPGSGARPQRGGGKPKVPAQRGDGKSTPQVPTGPNGPGSAAVPGGNR